MKQCCSLGRDGFLFSVFRRFTAAACALVLAVGLMPLAPAYGEEAPASDAGGAAASAEALLSAGPYVEGEALVVYQADAAPQRLRSLDASVPLAAAGFSVEDAWDFSGVDAAADESDAMVPQGANTFALGNESAGQNSGIDASILRVTKPGATTASLLEELGNMEGVLAAAPNYVHERVEDPVLGEDATAQFDAASAVLLAQDGAAQDAAASGSAPELPTLPGTDVLPVNGAAGSATNDPLASLQWSLDNNIVSSEGVAANSDVDFASVCQQAQSGKETIVAVLDDGADYTHEDLKDAMWSNPGTIEGLPGSAGSHGFDFVSGDDDPRPEAGDFHGTHCAGIVAAASNNGVGVSGVSPNTKIMAFRIGGADTGDNMSDGAVLASYEFLLRAKLAGENVVAASNSWGGVVSPVTEYAINQAGRAGVLTVFAAGNDDVDTNSIDEDKVAYGLSESPYVLMAAATSPLGMYASYTNHGENVVDVAAPGSMVLSTVVDDTFQPAVAKTLDEAANTPGEHSLYYHNMADLRQGNATIALSNGSGKRPDQSRLSAKTGIGLDGRSALRVSVENMTEDECVNVYWSIENPFKNMTWEQARRVCFSVLPGVAVATGKASNSAVDVDVWPLLMDDAGRYLLNGNTIAAVTDNLGGEPAKLASEKAFDGIRNADTLLVGAQVWATLDKVSAGAGTASFTLTDFGIGFADGQRYRYASGTSMACPLVAGAVGLLASVYPEESALEVRGRIVGGTKGLHDAASKDYPACIENWDRYGNPKQTASNGTLDLSKALGGDVHPNTWGARAADDGAAVELRGYRLDRTTSLSIDGVAVDGLLWQASADGSTLTVRQPDLLDGGRHAVEVSDGEASHRGAYALPLVDQTSAFQKVIDMPDALLPGQAGFDSGILVAAADRLFCLDSKGRYLYSYDPEGSGGWTACQAPVDAGFTALDFRADTTAAYADGKLYATVQYDQETGDKEKPAMLTLAVISYDIATDAWDADRLVFATSSPGQPGGYFPSIALAACKGNVYLTLGGASTRTFMCLDPRTEGGGPVAIDDESDPDGSFRLLRSARSVSLVAVGGELRFLGYVSEGIDAASGKERFALAVGTYDGQTFGVLDVPANAPRFEEDDLDALLSYTSQAVAATGDSLVLTGASADGLGATYQVNCETGEWTSLGVRAPGDGKAAVSTACFFQGTYYVLAASEGAQDAPATALYCLPEEVPLAANDHVASAQAGEGGTVEVTYGFGAQAAMRAANDARAGASSQVARVALGDTVTWTAVPSAGYEFAGWYDGEGALVGKDASYSQPVTSDVTLSARFAPVAGPGPDPGPGPEPGPTPTTLPGVDTMAKPLASTGDNIGFVAIAFATALVFGCAVCALLITSCRLRERRASRKLF